MNNPLTSQGELMEYIDLRSDTVTVPTAEMREAMAKAKVGDDVYGEDPTINELEALAAAAVGMEASVFVPTGTMGNQLSIMAHTRRGDEIISSKYAHIVQNEAGGMAWLSSVSTATVSNADTKLHPEDVHREIRTLGNPHHPITRLVCLENALGNGDVYSVAEMAEIKKAAREHKLKVHLDGARIFNAATALGVQAKDIAAQVDSVSFCISKGLCAPAGALVCGSKEFAAEVRRCRKAMGGGMRQIGVLGACGLIAINKMTVRLGEDHANARLLGSLLNEIPGITVNLDNIKINMVFWKTTLPNFNYQAYQAFMLAAGFKTSPPSAGSSRLATHNGVSEADVRRFVGLLKEFLAKA